MNKSIHTLIWLKLRSKINGKFVISTTIICVLTSSIITTWADLENADNWRLAGYFVPWFINALLLSPLPGLSDPSCGNPWGGRGGGTPGGLIQGFFFALFLLVPVWLFMDRFVNEPLLRPFFEWIYHTFL